jgi:hypothetical protein
MQIILLKFGITCVYSLMSFVDNVGSVLQVRVREVEEEGR